MTIMTANPYVEDMILYNDIPDPAHVCPTCRTDWFREGFRWVASDGMTVDSFPQAGACCPYCAIDEATEEQLYKAVKLAGAERLVVGHLLNVVLAFMSVLVHGVRLNTLEFSNHAGIRWGGQTYKPLKNFEQ